MNTTFKHISIDAETAPLKGFSDHRRSNRAKTEFYDFSKRSDGLQPSDFI
jgi:hypothetical protein